jgi:hypothetical protein
MRPPSHNKSLWPAAAGVAGLLILLAVLFAALLKDVPPPQAAVPVTPPPEEGIPAPLIGRASPDSLVHLILNPPVPLDYRQLLSRIDLLPDTLTEPESMTVCLALRRGLPEYKSLPQPQQHHLANQLMNALFRQQSRGEWLAAELAAVWRSKTADETLRDYAMQHLARLMEDGRKSSPHLTAWRAAGIPVLREAARDTGNRSAGTAILALHHLAVNSATNPPVIPVPELEDLVMSVAEDTAANASARAAAFQSAAALGHDGLLDAARSLAGDAGAPSGLRLSAIHYLGVCGMAGDRDLLNLIEAEDDLRFRPASRTALSRLISRHP